MGEASHQTSRAGIAVTIVVAVVAIGATLFFALRSSTQRQAPAPSTPVSTTPARPAPLILSATPRRPRPATLDPRQFKDPEIRGAYEIARRHPELLENIPCYCGCYGSNGHTNNHDCFTDRHGEG